MLKWVGKWPVTRLGEYTKYKYTNTYSKYSSHLEVKASHCCDLLISY